MTWNSSSLLLALLRGRVLLLSKELDMVLSLLLRLTPAGEVLERFTGTSSFALLALAPVAFLTDVLTGPPSTFVLISGYP